MTVWLPQYIYILIIGYLCGECRGDKGISVLLNKCVSCGYVNIMLIAALGLFRTGIRQYNVYIMQFSHCRCDSDNSNSFVFYNFTTMAPPVLILFTGNCIVTAVVCIYAWT